MFWRITRAEFARQAPNKGAGNKRAFRAMVDSGQAPGLLAYSGGDPIAWCSVGPRESYPSLERSPTLKRIDDQPVWSVMCFFMARPHRGQGLMSHLLRAAVDYAGRHGAEIVEGYPWEQSEARRPPGTEGFMGFAQAFRRAGFHEARRVTDRRLIMRCSTSGR
jgi:GNAT superfamily N-acetyltransferase